ncbi:MAG: hypothetical protein KBT47_01125 [Armatimonadetes bacterium]|nr:hypothetical protein [Candidatus Hippobium faecium]
MKKFWVILLIIGTVAAYAFTNRDLDIFDNSTPIPMGCTDCPEIKCTLNIESVESSDMPACYMLDCEELPQPASIEYKVFADRDGDYYIMCETMPLGCGYASPVSVYADDELYRAFRPGEETQTGGIFKGPKKEICWNYFGQISLGKGWHRIKFEINRKSPEDKYYQGFGQICLFPKDQSKEKWTVTPQYKSEEGTQIVSPEEYVMFVIPPYKVLSPVSEKYLRGKNAKRFNAVFDVKDRTGKIRDRFICPINFQKKDNGEILMWTVNVIYTPKNTMPKGEYSIVCRNFEREDHKPFRKFVLDRTKYDKK